jgi:tetratricopeptide (TPR) repeat protein
MESITASLRQFIMQHFGDDDLNIFCFDYFRDVSNNFTSGMTRAQKVQMLIEYCERGSKLKILNQKLGVHRTEAYEVLVAHWRIEATRDVSDEELPEAIQFLETLTRLFDEQAIHESLSKLFRKRSAGYKITAESTKQDFSAAMEDLRLAANLTRDRVEVWYEQAVLATEWGWADRQLEKEVMENLNRALLIKPNDHRLYCQRALLQQYHFTNTHRGIEDLTQAIKLKPEEPNYYRLRAHFHKTSGMRVVYDQQDFGEDKLEIYDKDEIELAIQDYSSALRLDPENASYFYNKAQCLEALGRYRVASMDYDYAIELSLTYSNDRQHIRDDMFLARARCLRKAALEAYELAMQHLQYQTGFPKHGRAQKWLERLTPTI